MKFAIRSLASTKLHSSESLITQFKSNHVGINMIRFILALLVLISHSWPLSGAGSDPALVYKNLNLTLGTFAVSLFFAISGFLVGYSAITRSPSVFIQYRILRIFPAYFFVLFISTFLLGFGIHLSAGLNFKYYFNLNQEGPFAYFLHNLIMPMDLVYKINDVFGSNPYSFAINGSLWTLPLEFRLYLLLLFLILVGNLIKRHFALMIMLLYLLSYFIIEELNIQILKNLYNGFIVENIHLISIFFLSSAVAVFGDRVRLNSYFILITLLFLFWTSFYVEIIGIVLILFLLPRISRVTNLNVLTFFKNDISYGFYIYAFPAQQTVIYFLPNLRLLEFIIISFLVTTALSLFSWKLIESPVLRINKNFNKTLPL